MADDGCRCWNEGEWGRVHREDCPIHGPDRDQQDYTPRHSGPCMEQGPAFPPAGFRPLCALEEGHEGEHDFVPQLAERNRQRAQVSEVCPDTGKCHHGCSAHYGGACWRVFNAGPLSGVFLNDEWPKLIRDAERLSLITAPPQEPEPEPDTQSMYVEIHMEVGPELQPEGYARRTIKLRARAVTEERDPSMAATYSVVAALREAADHLERMTSGPPVADTTTARLMT